MEGFLPASRPKEANIERVPLWPDAPTYSDKDSHFANCRGTPTNVQQKLKYQLS